MPLPTPSSPSSPSRWAGAAVRPVARPLRQAPAAPAANDAGAGCARGVLLTWPAPTEERGGVGNTASKAGSARLAAVPAVARPATSRDDRSSDGAREAGRVERDARLATLLAQAAAGQAAAFEAFYESTFGYAQALARRMLRDADLEDVLSEAYLQAWREVARFDAARGSAVTWLLTLVRSRALDALERARRHPSVADDEPHDDTPSDAPAPPDVAAGVEAGCALQRALLALSRDERWVLSLAYYRELPHSRIAEETGFPLGTVKSLILRAQHKLRAQLGAHA